MVLLYLKNSPSFKKKLGKKCMELGEEKSPGIEINRFVSLSLPNDFTHLLKMDIHKKGSLINYLNSYFLDRPSLYALVQKYLVQNSNGDGLEDFFHSTSWYNLRAKIAAIYIGFKEEGRWPDKINPSYVDELLLFEEKIKRYSVDGYSRGFLFAFYLKMVQVHSKQKNSFFPLSMINLLPLTKSKSIKIDWLLLIIFKFQQFFGEEKLIEKLKMGIPFEKNFSSLSPSQKEDFFSEGLSYAYSINDKETLLNLL
tara:strand:- start:1140 stop:1901 length:762 start_codon:yes stop_codon:yes gene_type:complete